MWNHSNIILQNRSGEIFGQGMQQAAGAISRGILGYREKRKEKEAETAAIDWIKANGQQLGVNTDDEGEVKAAVKAAGGGPQAIQMIQGMERMKQQKEMQAAQVDELKRQQEREQINRTALGAAMAPVEERRQRTPSEGLFLMKDQTIGTQRDPKGDEAVAAFLKAGGDPAQAGQLAQAYMSMEKMKALGNPKSAFMPQLVDLGNGVSAMTTSAGSAVPINKGAAANKPLASEIVIGGKKFTVGPGNKYFDENGAPVEFKGDEKPLTINEWIMSGQPPAQYKAYREAFSTAKEGPAKPATTSPGEARFSSADEGRKVKGPDGKMYVIKNGKPVAQ